ncbi:MAG: IS110 family transposase [Cyclobacteriaceae bacterium]|nr:IS110 family transposase [Cyclobacteriaceae bacterium SS2]MBV6641479.1 IS110 family transposase [Cyclobacteriaceae bacterium SS2]MBV6643783.1 IS110 family transposase [Cyclobacteriaceae bacterium SS2]
MSIQGEKLSYKTFNQPPDPSVLVKYLHRNYPGATYYACYEAGFAGFWIQEYLQSKGINCIVVNPNDVPTTDKEKKQKRDPLDSRKLARSLKNGELTPIHIPDKATQQDRCLVRLRQKIVGNQTRTRNRIKGLLYFFGIDYPEQFQNSGRHWSKRFIDWLKQLDLGHQSGNKALGLLVQEAENLRALILEVDRDILKLSKQENYLEDVRILISVPGIGRFTAMLWLTEVGDVKRFKSLDYLCSYVGLIPNVYGSGDKERIGDITKRGNKHLKSQLIESSWVAVRNDPALSLSYQQLCNRMSGNKAIIRITRKLLNRIRHLLINKEKYELGFAA